MRRRSGAGSQPVKPRRPKRPKRRYAPKAARGRGVSVAGQETEVARFHRERDEALERETATSDVLRLISKSPGDLELVFQSILENATRLCEAQFGLLFRHDGRVFNTLAVRNAPAVLLEFIEQRGAFLPPAGTVLHDLLVTRDVVHRADASAAHAQSAPVRLAGAKSFLAVPMFKDEALVGAISIFRQEVRPFTDKQIELVKNFAAQAVIAIENARLLNELRRRTDDLTVSLEQQTATSEVLQVISSSPADLEPVFATMLEKAVRICGATFGNVYRFDGKALHSLAAYNTPPAFAAVRKTWTAPLGSNNPLARVIATKAMLHVLDEAASEGYREGDPRVVAAVEVGGVRTLLIVPMLREDELVGLLTLARQQVSAFTDKQIELVKNFAAQAVIAIENARLLNELRQSLEQQTATADVLRVISSSPGELEPVFQAMLENATRICDARFGTLVIHEDGAFREVAQYNPPRDFAKARPINSVFRPPPGGLLARIVETKQPVHFEDISVLLQQAKQKKNATPLVELIKLAGARTMLSVPMLKESELIGAIGIYRQEVRPFTDKQIELVQNFAAQAVIAIENARLLTELRQRTGELSDALEQQTASSEVLSVISSSVGDLNPVFAAILNNATRICDAAFGSMLLCEDDGYRRVAVHNAPKNFQEFHDKVPTLRRGVASSVDRVINTRRVAHIIDVAIDDPNEPIGKFGGARTLLVVPMLKDNEAIGVLGIYRQEVRPFNDKQIALVQNFANQAVIAIENTRLLNELSKLNQQLEQRVADQVGEIERMGKLRRFLPPQVADLIVASGTEKQLESHRREITALFRDLRGFTGFSESSDPEDVMALLRDYHAAIGQIIIKYSGTLERYAGDGVMVIFNDPVPVENPALQAVLMALDMRTAIEALMEKWRLLGHDIGFGIGIAHGYATLGTIGFESRYDYAAIGTVSNVASRLCDEAKPGQILISPRVLLTVDKAVKVELVGEFALKGIRRPMMTYNVLEPLPSEPN